MVVVVVVFIADVVVVVVVVVRISIFSSFFDAYRIPVICLKLHLNIIFFLKRFQSSKTSNLISIQFFKVQYI